MLGENKQTKLGSWKLEGKEDVFQGSSSHYAHTQIKHPSQPLDPRLEHRPSPLGQEIAILKNTVHCASYFSIYFSNIVVGQKRKGLPGSVISLMNTTMT